MHTIAVRVDDDAVQWLDDMRGPGETRSHVVRKLIDLAMSSCKPQTQEAPAMPRIITWKFPEPKK
jgi:Arc/MetJ-type ribon-helix-helix transcriptional regulator